MVLRKKGRSTFTLTKRQEKILALYGGRNKSKWIGERIEEWYLFNKSEKERLTNKIKWTQLKKNELEDKLWALFKQRERLAEDEG